MSRRWLTTLLTFLIPAALFAAFVFGWTLLDHLDTVVAVASVALTILGLVTATAGGWAIAAALAQRRIRP